jgi:hypothetical protein
VTRPGKRMEESPDALALGALRHRCLAQVKGARSPTAKGFVFITMEDEDGLMNVTVRPDVYHKYCNVPHDDGLTLAEEAAREIPSLSTGRSSSHATPAPRQPHCCTRSVPATSNNDSSCLAPLIPGVAPTRVHHVEVPLPRSARPRTGTATIPSIPLTLLSSPGSIEWYRILL